MGFVNSEGKVLLDDNLGRFAVLSSEYEVLKVFRSSISGDYWYMCGAWWDESFIRYVHEYFEGGEKFEIGKADESGILESKLVTPSFGGLTCYFCGGRFLNGYYYLVGHVLDYPSAYMISALIAKVSGDYTVEWAKVYSDPDVSIVPGGRGLELVNGKLIVDAGAVIMAIDDSDGSIIAGKAVEKEGDGWILGGVTETVKASPSRIFAFNPYYLAIFDHSLNLLACKEEPAPHKLSGKCSASLAVKPDGNILALSEGTVDNPGRIVIEFSPEGAVLQAKRLASSYSGLRCGLKAEIVNDKLYACWEANVADSLIGYLIVCGADLSFPGCPIWSVETVTFDDLACNVVDAVANVEDAAVNITDVTSKFSPVTASFTKECPA